MEIDNKQRVDMLIKSFSLSISLLEIVLTESDIDMRSKAAHIFTKLMRRHLRHLNELKATINAECDKLD